MRYFADRSLVIATQHGKEQVIAPILSKEFGVHVIVNTHVNTDTQGTFTGTIARTLSPLEAAIKKCELAMDHYQVDLAIASEGSFGQHPSLWFAACDDELVVLVDRKNKWVFKAREISTQTNFEQAQVSNLEELENYLQRVQFPSHQVYCKEKNNNDEWDIKYFSDIQQLKETAASAWDRGGHLELETDMRAMNNPTRMKVIELATQKLIEIIKTPCPSCHLPGFAISSAIEGLPCSACLEPTQSTKAHQYKCDHCSFEEQRNDQITKKFEDPMYCPHCNP